MARPEWRNPDKMKGGWVAGKILSLGKRDDLSYFANHRIITWMTSCLTCRKVRPLLALDIRKQRFWQNWWGRVGGAITNSWGRTKVRWREQAVPLCLLPVFTWKNRTWRANEQEKITWTFQELSIQYKREDLSDNSEGLWHFWWWLRYLFCGLFTWISAAFSKGLPYWKTLLKLVLGCSSQINVSISGLCCSECIFPLWGSA